MAYKILKTIWIFLKNIATGFPIYKEYKKFRIYTALTTYLSATNILLPFCSSIFNPELKEFFDKEYIKWTLPIISFLIIINNYIVLSVKENILQSKIEIKSKLTRESIRNYLDFLLRYYGWEAGFRATIFIHKQEEKREFIIPYERISYGQVPGVQPSNLKLKLNEGLPGKAWNNAWNGENYSTLIESLQIQHIPPEMLKSEAKLKKYFKDTFGINDTQFLNFSDRKNLIKSYLAIGFIGIQSKLSGILVIDSEKESAFSDFEKLKKIKGEVIQGEKFQLQAAKAIFDQNKGKNNVDSGKESVEGNRKAIDIIEMVGDNIQNSDPVKVAEMIKIMLSRFQRPIELDKFVIVLSLVIRNVQRLLNDEN